MPFFPFETANYVDASVIAFVKAWRKTHADESKMANLDKIPRF